MELRPGRVRQGHGRSWKRRAFTKNLREVGDVLFLRKVVPVWYPSIGARGRNTLPIARQTTRRPAVFAIPGLPHLAVFSVGIDGSVIHNSLLKQLVTGHGSFGDHDSSVIPSSEGARVASGLAPSPGHPAMPRKDDASACSAKPLGPEPLVSKGLQLQLHFWDRNQEGITSSAYDEHMPTRAGDKLHLAPARLARQPAERSEGERQFPGGWAATGAVAKQPGGDGDRPGRGAADLRRIANEELRLSAAHQSWVPHRSPLNVPDGAALVPVPERPGTLAVLGQVAASTCRVAWGGLGRRSGWHSPGRSLLRQSAGGGGTHGFARLDRCHESHVQCDSGLFPDHRHTVAGRPR